jgi:hypothetical protein
LGAGAFELPVEVAAGTIQVNFFIMFLAQTYFLPAIVAVAPDFVQAPFALLVAAREIFEPEIRRRAKEEVANARLVEVLISLRVGHMPVRQARGSR